MRGKVVRFYKEKGYGFIKCDTLKEDIFFHFTEIVQEGFKTCEVGQEVEFDLQKNERGYIGKRVIKMN